MARDRLYFLFMPGCHACARVKRMVMEFLELHPDVKLIPFNLETTAWEAENWVPRTSPTLIKLDAEGRNTIFDGETAEDGAQVITDEGVKQWLRSNF